jgi:ribulose-bisphosphate carboxylase small chain
MVFALAAKAAVAPAVAVRSKAAKSSAFRVWQPVDNKFFETFSYLPPLSDADIAKQVDYITRNGWVPALEFADPGQAYVADTNTDRIRNSVGYQDNRYWSMYKLPMFGCTDSSQVLKEIQSATKSFPKAYIRLVAFDPNRQVQVAGMLVHRPKSDDIQAPENRSI